MRSKRVLWWIVRQLMCMLWRRYIHMWYVCTCLCKYGAIRCTYGMASTPCRSQQSPRITFSRFKISCQNNVNESISVKWKISGVINHQDGGPREQRRRQQTTRQRETAENREAPIIYHQPHLIYRTGYLIKIVRHFHPSHIRKPYRSIFPWILCNCSFSAGNSSHTYLSLHRRQHDTLWNFTSSSSQ